MRKLLLIDDNIHQHKLFECYVSLCTEIELELAIDIDQALDLLDQEDPDIVFLDNRLHPFDSYSETVPMLRSRGFKGKIVVISANVSSSMATEFKSKSVAAMIDKSDFSLANFNTKIESLLLN
ncbi:response regulator [Hoeflea sp.]|uniref:response regulator n=1 Tax=Hoeflea sp. TaxID=1940281 RepID=UPI00374A0146